MKKLLLGLVLCTWGLSMAGCSKPDEGEPDPIEGLNIEVPDVGGGDTVQPDGG